MLLALQILFFFPSTGVDIAAVIVDAEIQAVWGVLCDARRAVRTYTEDALVQQIIRTETPGYPVGFGTESDYDMIFAAFRRLRTGLEVFNTLHVFLRII